MWLLSLVATYTIWELCVLNCPGSSWSPLGSQWRPRGKPRGVALASVVFHWSLVSRWPFSPR